MEGWTRKGEVLKCVSCGAVIEELKEEKTEKKVSPLENDAALKFKSLLGRSSGRNRRSKPRRMKRSSAGIVRI